MDFAKGSLLAQVAPANTTAATAYTCGDVPTEITRILVCNTTAVAAAARIFHDDAAASYVAGTALWYDKNIPANETVELTSPSVGAGIHLKKSGTIGVRTGTANALTFSIYGITATLAQRVSAGRS